MAENKHNRYLGMMLLKISQDDELKLCVFEIYIAYRGLALLHDLSQRK